MTEEERLELQRDFCVKTVQDMSDKDRISFAYNVLMDSYSNYSDEDFTEEVKAWFPELLTIDVEKEEGCD
tara:strand:- start:226 stop:435 length:210 start_codon:yes stop_codon:yes gene_type:complete